MNKSLIVNLIIEQLTSEIESIKSAAEEARNGAIHDQSKAETQYDTLALEHAYLAEGLSNRIETLKQNILTLSHMPLPESNDIEEIVLGALITVRQTNNHSVQRYFLAACGGGIKIEIDSVQLQIVTPESPIGETILGLEAGEQADLPNGVNVIIESVE